jgi:exosortase
MSNASHKVNRPSTCAVAVGSASLTGRAAPWSGQPSASLVAAAVLLAATFVWAYWPTVVKLVHAWNTEPDYSHGYLVVPVALFFLWARRAQMPPIEGPAWAGLALLLVGLVVRVAGSAFFIDSLDGWSLPLWLGGVCWLCCGWNFLAWCLPSLAFLWFMVPLPFRAAGVLSMPLQRIATRVSTWTLQSLGQPALAEGNVIRIGDVQLEVAQACSGLSIFMSVVALAFAYAVLVKRPWWTKLLLFASVLPIALVTNAVRVTITGIAYPAISTESGRHLAHDVAGWVVIPLAAALMGLFLWYLGRLIVEVRPVDRRELLKAT